MNGIVKPVYTIQETPKGEWRLTKGVVSYVFPSEKEALAGMDRMINNSVKGYDKDGKLIT